MSQIIPFRAIRPTRDKVHLVASRSYVMYNKRDLERKLKENPYTFIHIINPEFDIRKKSKASHLRFEKVRKRFEDFVEAGVFQKEEEPSFYIYRQIKSTGAYTGLIAGVCIDEYFDGKIKVHESTLSKREKLFRDYLDICNFNAEPVLLTYPDRADIENKVEDYTSQRPEYDFTTTNMVRHQLWVIDNKADQKFLQNAFESVDALYIADGHHRTASSALLGQLRRQQKPNFSGTEMFNYIMAMLMPQSKVKIFEFNRLIKDLNGLSEPEFIESLKRVFSISKSESAIEPKQKHEFGLYLNRQWYHLKLHSHLIDNSSPLSALDTNILTKTVITPILGITDVRTDNNISCLPGNVPIAERQALVDKGMFKLLFTLHKLEMEDVMSVADAREIMPPKSSWIEPKLRSGLTIFSLEDR